MGKSDEVMGSCPGSGPQPETRDPEPDFSMKDSGLRTEDSGLQEQSNRMNSLPLLVRLFEYSDWANAQVLSAAAGLSDEQLDRPLEIGPGPGTLRRVLMHTWAGEDMWLRRWQGEIEARWPAESERLGGSTPRSLRGHARPPRAVHRPSRTPRWRACRTIATRAAVSFGQRSPTC